jgi:DNA-binding response OmpR family regulator
MNGSRILVIEDNDTLRRHLGQLLDRAGLRALETSSGAEGLRALYSEQPDLVVLDVGLPGLDGWQVLERLRELTDVPVMMLTSHDSEMEKVRGLKAGADDYVTKPFGPQELLARIETLLRRRGGEAQRRERYDDGVVAVDFAGQTAIANGRSISLTPLEFRLLSAFVQNPNQILGPEQLLDLAWGGADRASRDQVKLYVGYLRRKLRAAGVLGSVIENVRGFGYRYRSPGR